MNIPKESKEVLVKLLKGNQQFINGKYEAKNITIETLRQLATCQSPHACVLSCSDSRVVPEEREVYASIYSSLNEMGIILEMIVLSVFQNEQSIFFQNAVFEYTCWNAFQVL